MQRIGLVGCVKQKAGMPLPARDLYTSALFRGRRAYVEGSCQHWWILSALHGLVDPGTVIEPYDVSLKQASTAQRRDWSRRVLAELAGVIHLMPGDVVEIHAGSEYRDFGLVVGLRSQGLDVVIPTLGLPMGRQLQFYGRGGKA